jgi:hypothetical protein
MLEKKVKYSIVEAGEKDDLSIYNIENASPSDFWESAQTPADIHLRFEATVISKIQIGKI